MMTKEEAIRYVENEARSLDRDGVVDSYLFIKGAKFGAGVACNLLAEEYKGLVRRAEAERDKYRAQSEIHRDNLLAARCRADGNERELKALQTKYSGMRCRAEQAELELEHTRQEVLAGDKHRVQLEAELATLLAELDAEIDVHDLHVLRDKVEALESKSEALHAELDEQTQQRAMAVRSLGSLKREHARESEEHSRAIAKLATLRAENEALRKRAEKVDAELDVEREHTATWERTATHLLKRAEEAEAELSALRKENEELRAEIDSEIKDWFPQLSLDRYQDAYITIVQPPKPPEPDTREEWEHCPNLNHTNHPRDKFCMECGKSLIKRMRRVTLERWVNVGQSHDGTKWCGNLWDTQEEAVKCKISSETCKIRTVPVTIAFWEESKK